MAPNLFLCVCRTYFFRVLTSYGECIRGLFSLRFSATTFLGRPGRRIVPASPTRASLPTHDRRALGDPPPYVVCGSLSCPPSALLDDSSPRAFRQISSAGLGRDRPCRSCRAIVLPTCPRRISSALRAGFSTGSARGYSLCSSELGSSSPDDGVGLDNGRHVDNRNHNVAPERATSRPHSRIPTG